MLCSLLLTMSFSWVVTFFELLCMFQIPGGSTDCTLPITWATENGKAVDVFIILTNNPLWTFSASPVETLKKHRQVCTTFRYYYCCCYIISMCIVVVILLHCLHRHQDAIPSWWCVGWHPSDTQCLTRGTEVSWVSAALTSEPFASFVTWHRT